MTVYSDSFVDDYHICDLIVYMAYDYPLSDTNQSHVTPRFLKYEVRVRDDIQQILTKRKISSVNTLGCQ